MHELSIAQNIAEIVTQEMDKHGLTSVKVVRIKHGRLTTIVPEALEMGWMAVTRETPLEGSEIETIEVPLVLKCPGCEKTFEAEGEIAIFGPCPHCDEQAGHTVESGRELYIENIEGE